MAPVPNDPDSYSPARTSIGSRRSSADATQLSSSSRSRDSLLDFGADVKFDITDEVSHEDMKLITDKKRGRVRT